MKEYQQPLKIFKRTYSKTKTEVNTDTNRNKNRHVHIILSLFLKMEDITNVKHAWVQKSEALFFPMRLHYWY